MESSKALGVLGSMGGMSVNQARRYLEQCTSDEVALLELCEDGKQYKEAIDAISDRMATKV